MKWWDVWLNAPSPHPHPPVSLDREMTILSCQEDKVMRLAALRSLFLFFHLSLSEAVHRSRKRLFFFFIFIVIAWNILVWVSEAPTLLCGPRASLKFRVSTYSTSFQYMVLAGGNMFWLFLLLFFYPWTSIHPETETPREDQRSSQTDLISLHWIYEYFYQSSFDLSVSAKQNLFLFPRNQTLDTMARRSSRLRPLQRLKW